MDEISGLTTAQYMLKFGIKGSPKDPSVTKSIYIELTSKGYVKRIRKSQGRRQVIWTKIS